MEIKDHVYVFDQLQFILSKLISIIPADIPADSEILQDILKKWSQVKDTPKTKYCKFDVSSEMVVECYNILWNGVLKLSRSDHNYVNVIWNYLQNLDEMYEIILPMSYKDALDTCSKAARQAITDEHRSASYNCDLFNLMRHDIKELFGSGNKELHVLSEIKRIVTSLDH